MRIGLWNTISPKRLFVVLAVLMPALMLMLGLAVVSAAVQPSSSLVQPTQSEDTSTITMSIALAIGLPAIAAGYALAKSGSAALSSLVERPETFFKAFLVVTLCEAIAIYGLIIAILLWLKI
ncbi:MAG: ATP synthase subunit C [Candidatus Verstraetearchaeota archaeon]|nr:ATP synthase subunit C [Candidatus Verstraetearchaeota archaeon]